MYGLLNNNAKPTSTPNVIHTHSHFNFPLHKEQNAVSAVRRCSSSYFTIQICKLQAIYTNTLYLCINLLAGLLFGMRWNLRIFFIKWITNSCINSPQFRKNSGTRLLFNYLQDFFVRVLSWKKEDNEDKKLKGWW